MKLSRILIFLLALGQILISIFGGFNGQDAYSTAIITPAGYAFSIWGLITFGCVLYGIYGLLPSQKKNKLLDAVSVPVIGTFIGFIVWVEAARFNLLWITVGIFLSMLIALWTIFKSFVSLKKPLKGMEAVFVYGTFGLYLGWSTAAFPLNIMAALVYDKVIAPGVEATPVYLVIIAIELIFAFISQYFVKTNYYVTAAILWAFTAIFVRTFDNHAYVLAGASFAATATFLLSAIFLLSPKKK